MTFVKLDTGILDSSLWVEAAEVRIAFITMLAMCEPDGLCRATAPGIARRANLPLEAVRRALDVLEAPDPESRSTADEGRRIRRIDGGYVVTNYLRYRKWDHTAADRKRRQREREKGPDDPLSPRPLSQETEADAEAEAEGHVQSRSSRVTDRDPKAGGGGASTKGNGSATARELKKLEADPMLAELADAWSHAFRRPGRQIGVLRAASAALAGGYTPDAVKLVVRVVALAAAEPERFPDRGSIRWAVEHGKAGDPSYVLRPATLDRLIPEAEAWDRS